MSEVVIVGASIAGSSTAIRLARSGRDVLIIDKVRFPRTKPCGEGLFPAGVEELRRLGVFAAVQGQGAALRRVRFSGGGHAVSAPLSRDGDFGLGIRRSVLDEALLQEALAAGADVKTGVTATGLLRGNDGTFAVETDAGVLRAGAIVAADGLHSRLRWSAGLARPPRGARYGVSAHVEVDREPEPQVEVYFEPGYELYLTPVGGRCLNVAILTSRLGMKRFAGDLGRAFSALLSAHPAFGTAARVVDQPGAAGPFPVTCGRAWRDNLVLAGDAAGFCDGISGEGMSLALVTSADCAGAVERYLDNGRQDAFEAYDRRRRARARNSTLLARLTLALSRRSWTAERALRNLGRRPETFAKLVAINTGELGFRALRPADVSALLLGL